VHIVSHQNPQRGQFTSSRIKTRSGDVIDQKCEVKGWGRWKGEWTCDDELSLADMALVLLLFVLCTCLVFAVSWVGVVAICAAVSPRHKSCAAWPLTSQFLQTKDFHPLPM